MFEIEEHNRKREARGELYCIKIYQYTNNDKEKIEDVFWVTRKELIIMVARNENIVNLDDYNYLLPKHKEKLEMK